MVYDVAWGFDPGEDVAHVTTNVSPGPRAEHGVDFFHANEVSRIQDPETGAVLFAAHPG